LKPSALRTAPIWRKAKMVIEWLNSEWWKYHLADGTDREPLDDPRQVCFLQGHSQDQVSSIRGNSSLCTVAAAM